MHAPEDCCWHLFWHLNDGPFQNEAADPSSIMFRSFRLFHRLLGSCAGNRSTWSLRSITTSKTCEACYCLWLLLAARFHHLLLDLFTSKRIGPMHGDQCARQKIAVSTCTRASTTPRFKFRRGRHCGSFFLPRRFQFMLQIQGALLNRIMQFHFLCFVSLFLKGSTLHHLKECRRSTGCRRAGGRRRRSKLG